MEIVHGIEAMVLLPLYLTEILGSSVTLVGAVISTYLIVDIIARTPAGWLADKWGRKTVLLWGIILSMVRPDLHFAGNMVIIYAVSEKEDINE